MVKHKARAFTMVARLVPRTLLYVSVSLPLPLPLPLPPPPPLPIFLSWLDLIYLTSVGCPFSLFESA